MRRLKPRPCQLSALSHLIKILCILTEPKHLLSPSREAFARFDSSVAFRGKPTPTEPDADLFDGASGGGQTSLRSELRRTPPPPRCWSRKRWSCGSRPRSAGAPKAAVLGSPRFADSEIPCTACTSPTETRCLSSRSSTSMERRVGFDLHSVRSSRARTR